MHVLQIHSIAIVIFLLLPAAAMVGQQPAPSATETQSEMEAVGENGAEETAASVLIAPGEVTSKLTVDSNQLKEIETSIRPDPEISAIALEFYGRGQAAAELNQALQGLKPETATVRQLEDQRREWTSFRNQLERWSVTVDQRWRELQDTRDQLREIEQRWQLTRETLSDEELPAELRQRGDQILERVGQLRAEIRERIDQLAAVTERLTESKETTNASLNRLAEMAEQVNRRLMVRDAPPLWQVGVDQWRVIDQSSISIGRQLLTDLRLFAITKWPRLLTHLFILAALLAGIFHIRADAQSWPEDDPKLQRARDLLARPYSLAIALATIPFVFLYGELPVSIRDVFLLIALFALFRHVRTLTHDRERPVVVSLLTLSVIYELTLLPSLSSISRITLLFAELGLLAITGLAFHCFRRDPDSPGLWHRAALACAGIALAAGSAVAVAAGVLGWVSFSQFLGEGILLSCRGFLLLALMVRAWSAFWLAFLRQGPGRRLLSVRRAEATYFRYGVYAVAIAIGWYWIQQVSRRFRLDGVIESNFAEVRKRPLSWATWEITLGDLLNAVVILAVTYAIQRVLRFLLDEEFFPRLRFGTSSTAVWATLIKYAIVAGGLAMAASALGFNATQLTVLFGALGVGIGFGLQNIVSNFVSGLILMFERPIKVGDIVEVGGLWGKVKQIGIRATVVDAFEGSELVVPNGDLIAKEVKNWTLSATTARVEILVGTAYDSDPREVLRILLRTAEAHEFVAEEPPPFAMMYEFGESALNFRLLCHTTIDKRGIVISDLHIQILEALSAVGIQIPFPQRDLHLSPIDQSALELDRLSQSR